MTTLNASVPDTGQRVLDAATGIYFAEGLGALTMRRVAAEAGVSTMATYRHFRDKDDLLDGMVKAGFDLFDQTVARALRAPDPHAQLWECARLYLHFALTYPRYYDLMFHGGVWRESPRPAHRRKMATARRFLTTRVRDYANHTGRSDLHPRRTALTMWAHSHGLVSLHLGGRFERRLPFRSFYMDSMTTLFAGLGIPGPDDPRATPKEYPQ